MLYPNTVRVIWIIAVLSGLLTYDGITSTAASTDWWLKSVYALTAIVVTVMISHFWQYAFGIVPELSLGIFRGRGWIIVVSGMFLILAVSTYWNGVSLTKHEISRLGGGTVVLRAEKQLGDTSRSINGYQTFLIDVASLATDLRALQRAEEAGGSSGIASKGPVSRTFGQVAERVETISASAATAKNKMDRFQTQAARCLADLKTAMSNGDQSKASNAASCINQKISEMAGMDIAGTLARSLSQLTSGVVLPATIKREAQRQAISRFLQEAKTRTDALADKISNREQFPLPAPLTLEQPNILRGLLLHWQSLIPALATALAIDLLPFILLLFTALRFDDQEQRGKPRRIWTADEMQEARMIYHALLANEKATTAELDLPDYIDIDPSSHKQLGVDVAEGDEAEPNQLTVKDGANDKGATV